MTAPALAADPVFGSFALDATPGGDHCAAFTLEDLGSGKFRYTAARVTADGKLQRQDGVFAFDGVDHPDGAGGTLAFMRIDESRYALVAKGTVHATAMRTLSGDSLTEIADGTDDGDAFHASRVYTRGGARCGD